MPVPAWSLALTGRNPDRLENVAKTCRDKGATVITGCYDILDAQGLNAWIVDFDAQYPVDLCIANAGLSGGTGGGAESLKQITQIFNVNILGVINAVTPLVELMRRRGQGHVAMVSSIAGFRGSLAAPAYSASKAAVIAYGQGLRGFLQPSGIKVSTICPGFIRTPMTDVNPFPMPLIMNADRAAKIIKRRLASSSGLIAFPWPTALLARFMNLLPDVLVDKMLRRVPAKPAHQGE